MSNDRKNQDVAEALDSIEDVKRAVEAILFAAGYPVAYEKGKEICFKNLDEDIVLCHAGTRRTGEKLFTDGGRVLGVCAKGASLEEARKKAYKNVEKIHFDGMHYRKDIGIKYKDVERE